MSGSCSRLGLELRFRVFCFGLRLSGLGCRGWTVLADVGFRVSGWKGDRFLLTLRVVSDVRFAMEGGSTRILHVG